MRRTLHLLAILTAAALVLLSCSEKLSKQSGLSAQDLFSRGQQKMAKKKYDSAIEHFQVLLERFPTSPLAPRAQLALADAHMENKDDVEAEVGYDDFLRLYPASDNVPYALYRKGELLFRQRGKPGRDQTKTVEAIRTFRLLLEKSPSDPHAAAAARRIAELRNLLAEHEVAVVSHYLARKKYESAEARARRAVADYTDTTSLPTLMSLLAQALDRQGKKEEAAEVRKSLREKFPGGGDKKR
jgi:outer membrane protein assembly factor BamD